MIAGMRVFVLMACPDLGKFGLQLLTTAGEFGLHLG
jgi:hypothetical protein